MKIHLVSRFVGVFFYLFVGRSASSNLPSPTNEHLLCTLLVIRIYHCVDHILGHEHLRVPNTCLSHSDLLSLGVQGTIKAPTGT